MKTYHESDTYKPTSTLVEYVEAVVDHIDKPDIDRAMNPGMFYILLYV